MVLEFGAGTAHVVRLVSLPFRERCVIQQGTRVSLCHYEILRHKNEVSRTSIFTCHATPVPGGPPSEPGDANVQDALAQMMQVNVKSKIYQAEVDKEAAKQRELLIQKAEEAKQEIDRIVELNKARSDLAFGSAMADIDENYREFEEKLRESRRQMEQDESDFEAFREKVANDRNAGLFYKNLYVDKELEEEKRQKRRAHGTLHDLSRQEIQQAAQASQRDVRPPTSVFVLLGATFIINSVLLANAVQGDADWTSIAAVSAAFVLGLSLAFIGQRGISQVFQEPVESPSSKSSSRQD